MKFVSVELLNGYAPAVVDGEDLVLLSEAFPDLVAVIEGGQEALTRVRALIEHSRTPRLMFENTRLGPPITRFRRDVLCTGWNYWDHFEEGRETRSIQERPKAPTFFTKSPDTVAGPTSVIPVDGRISPTWDYEAEVALVFGTTGRSIATSAALDHVFGYMLANDVSQRDLQRRHGGQWMKGKSIDGTMPLGPLLVTADELDPQNEEIECRLNGEVMQKASTRQMAFSIPDLIAELSLGMTVRAGDVLLTGTPSGVGQSRKPPVFLKDGDEVVIASANLGAQHNGIVQTDLYGASDVVMGD